MIDVIEQNEYVDELRTGGSTWDEVCDMCNTKFKVNYGESKWRKPYETWRVAVEYVLNDASNKIMDKELEKIARAKNRLDIARKVSTAQKKELLDDLNKESKYELLNSITQDALIKCSPKLTEVKITTKPKNKNYVFINADSHYNGYQDLNVEFSEKLAFIRKQKEKYGFEEIIWAELADLIEGATLRHSQLLALKNGMVDQAVIVSKYYIEFLNKASEELDINIIVPFVTRCNHSELRNGGSGRGELPMEDLMQLIAQNIELGTKNNDRIKMITEPDKSRIITTINGIPYLFEHGDEVTNVKTHVKTIEEHSYCKIDYGYIGHTHTYQSIDLMFNEERGFDKNITVCPSSNVIEGDFQKKLKIRSAPAIHFCIDTDKGKEHQENMIMHESLKHYKKQSNNKHLIKIK